MATTIILTPPNQSPETVTAFENVSVQQTMTDRAGSFNITLPFFAETDITRFVIGTDVQINQDGHTFRGYVNKPPVQLNGHIKTLTLEGADYSAKTQKIVVTESYANKSISYIVDDLFTKYTTFDLSVQDCPITINLNLPDLFLWDVMENLCLMCGYNWTINSNLVVQFFSPSVAVNPNSITESNYYKGTASFDRDATKLVNKLWVKGSNTLSAPIVETKTLTANPISLLYQPHNIVVTVGGVTKSVGIQNVDASGTKDLLLNYNEKLLVPDLLTTGIATITYNYQYPVKVLLWEDTSLTTYGQFEDIFKVNTGDVELATQMGLQYLAKYSRPVLIGSIDPFSGNYNAGELVNVNIPNLSINEDLIIKGVSYESSPFNSVKIKLSLENTTGDLVNILKSFAKRLDKLESLQTQNDNEIVQQYRTYNDTLIYPKLTDAGLEHTLHDYILVGMPYTGGFYL